MASFVVKVTKLWFFGYPVHHWQFSLCFEQDNWILKNAWVFVDFVNYFCNCYHCCSIYFYRWRARLKWRHETTHTYNPSTKGVNSGKRAALFSSVRRHLACKTRHLFVLFRQCSWIFGFCSSFVFPYFLDVFVLFFKFWSSLLFVFSCFGCLFRNTSQIIFLERISRARKSVLI